MATPDYHLVVLVHGLWGNISHFDHIVQALQNHADKHWSDGKTQLLIYTTTLNEGFRTYDGIDVCGFRVAEEIAHQIELFERSSSPKEPRKISKFSLIGYSLGGLIARYALGLLYKRRFFKKREIALINFTSFCTPHVGVLAPGKNVAVGVFNSLVPWLLGSSGRQMFLKDNVHNHGLNAQEEPLIYLMSHEDSVFFKSLQSFKYKSLYANVVNDKRTAWWTAGISLNDPFFNVNEYNGIKVFQYVPGYETVVIDRDQDIVISQQTADEIEEFDQIDQYNHEAVEDFFFLNYWIAKLGRWIMVVLNLCIIAPLMLVCQIAHSGMEMAISAVRVTRFLNNYSTQFMQDFFEISAPRPLSAPHSIQDSEREKDESNDVITPRPALSNGSSCLSIKNTNSNNNNYNAWGESLNDQADNLMESIYEAIERKNMHAGFLEEAPSESGVVQNYSLAVSIRELENQSTAQLASRQNPSTKELIENLHLDLSPKQVAIIKSLNKINWRKYPIYIRKTPSAHACSIVRQQDPLFSEGEIVIKHWIEQVFQIA